MRERPKRFGIEYQGDGTYQIMVDGVDISDELHSVEVRCAAGEEPVVVVSRLVLPERLYVTTAQADVREEPGDGLLPCDRERPGTTAPGDASRGTFMRFTRNEGRHRG